ncbi:hypothetical protein IJG78_00550, partial [Candidatus Saccharibacteria bacterium]|nr:hypothetical protein [Candidatus Saccharibacteria bacterium]
QDMTPEVCSSATTPLASAGTSTATIDTTGTHQGDNAYVPQRTLYDYRGIDGTGTASSPATGSNQVSYVIRKLADGNCWMSENLKLTLSTSHSYEVATFSGGTTSWTPTSCSTNGTCAMNGNTVYTGSGSSRKCWYSWYAATAESETTLQSGEDAPNSICPKGWRLPANYSINTTKSYGALTNAYFGYATNMENTSDYAELESIPLSFSQQGWYDRGGPGATDTRGFYWSSTVNEPINTAYILLYSRPDRYMFPQYRASKHYGFPMRCMNI